MGPEFDLPVVLTLTFLACSIGTCSAVLLHFLFKKEGISDTASRLLFCLALSDLIGASTWFVDTFFPSFCPISGALNMFGYQSAQIWTCIIGAYLIITCSAKPPPPEAIFYAIAWGLPLIIQVAVLSLRLYHTYKPPQGCWIEYGTLQLLFVTIPQLTAVVLNMTFLGTIIYKMRISAKRWGLKSRDRGLFFVMICFVLTTVGSILESIPQGGGTIYTIAVCFGALQGFFNSIAMKQRAILQFMGKVTTKIRPPVHKETTASTWLLADNKQHVHPAMNDSYDTYARTVHGRARQASMSVMDGSSGSLTAAPTPGNPTPTIQ